MCCVSGSVSSVSFKLLHPPRLRARIGTPAPFARQYPSQCFHPAARLTASSNCAYLVSHLRILHDRALGISLFRLTGFLALLDLRDHALEGFADVLVVARARFGEAAAQLFGEFLAVGEGDLALLGAQIGLVADDCEGDGIGALEEGRFSLAIGNGIGDCWEVDVFVDCCCL